jgi:hypothetical protein
MLSKIVCFSLLATFVLASFDAEARSRKRRKPSWKMKVEGQFEPQLRIYESDDNESNEDIHREFVTRFEWKTKKRYHRTKLQLVSRAVAEDSASSSLFVKEAWYSYRQRYWEFLAGANFFTWSTLEVFNPIEVLNAVEFIEQEKIGEPMISYKRFMGNRSLQFYYLPLNTDHIYPSAKSRGLGLTLGNTYWVKDNEELYQGRLANNFALEWKHGLGSLDYRLLFFHGPDRSLELFSFDGSSFHPIFFKANMLGGNMQAALWGSTVKFEFLSKMYSHEYNSIKPESHQVMALGFEYPFIFDSGSEISLIFEWQQAMGIDSDTAASYYTFQSDIFVGGRYVKGDIQGTQILFGLLHDLSREKENALSIEYSRRLNSKWKLELGAQARLAPQKGSLPLGLERQDGQNYIYSKLFYYFR